MADALTAQNILIVNNTDADLRAVRTAIIETAISGVLSEDIADLFEIELRDERRANQIRRVAIVRWA